jgi:hypothetical protein
MADSGLRHDELHLVLQDGDTDEYADENEKIDESGAYLVAVVDGQGDEINEDESSMAKRQRLDDALEDGVTDNGLPSLQNILYDMNKSMCLRLDSIEKKLENLDRRTKRLEAHVEQFVTLKQMPAGLQSTRAGHYPSVKTSSGAIIIGLPVEKSTDDDAGDESSSSNFAAKFNMSADDIAKCSESAGFKTSEFRTLGSNVTLITLNTKDDYPNGSWLGNENVPDQRVRVPISQSDLLHIESNCRTPEKMALALLDYLFDRDTQACSNLSGMGKHGKKKLDPLFIYGMRCHLVYRFGISEKDWHRIKLNIDSKCRTAFRRKMRGQPLTVKAFRGKSSSSSSGYMYVQVGGRQNGESDDDNSFHASVSADLQITESSDLAHAVQLPTNNQFQVIAATPEQVARLKPRLQLLSDGQYVLQAGLDLSGHDGVSLSTDDIISIVTSETGELIHILPEDEVGVNSIAHSDAVSTSEPGIG